MMITRVGFGGGGGASAVKPATVFREGDIVRFAGFGERDNDGFPGEWRVEFLGVGGATARSLSDTSRMAGFVPAAMALVRRPVRVGDVVRAARDRLTDTTINTDEQAVLDWAKCGWAHADGTAIDPPPETGSLPVCDENGDAVAANAAKAEAGVRIAKRDSRRESIEAMWPEMVAATWPTHEEMIARSLWRTDPDVRALIDEKSDSTLCRQTSLVREMVLEGRPHTVYGTYEYATNDAAAARAESVAWKIDDRGLRTRGEAGEGDRRGHAGWQVISSEAMLASRAIDAMSPAAREKRCVWLANGFGIRSEVIDGAAHWVARWMDSDGGARALRARGTEQADRERLVFACLMQLTVYAGA